MSLQATPLSFLFIHFLAILFPAHPTNSALETFLFGGCSQIKYTPGTPYESNVNSLLTSLVNSASFSNFNNFKISVPGSKPNDIVYGLFQCRGDLRTSDCHRCVAQAVGQMGTLCGDSVSGALQLEGCFIKYDNISFLGVEDKSVALKRCGFSIGSNSEQLSRRDALLDYLEGNGDQYFRVGGSGDLHGVAQCVQDLSGGECQDCLNDAIGRLKSDCGSAAWGDVFLGKCYARFTEHGRYTNNGSDDQVQKTLAILIGLIAGVAVLVVFLSIISRAFDKRGGK